ncbi:transposase, partial [Acidiphilium angustum]
WRGIQFDTLRLRLIKLAVQVETLKKSIRLHLPRSMPDQVILRYALARLPRLLV